MLEAKLPALKEKNSKKNMPFSESPKEKKLKPGKNLGGVQGFMSQGFMSLGMFRCFHSLMLLLCFFPFLLTVLLEDVLLRS